MQWDWLKEQPQGEGFSQTELEELYQSVGFSQLTIRTGFDMHVDDNQRRRVMMVIAQR